MPARLPTAVALASTLVLASLALASCGRETPPPKVDESSADAPPKTPTKAAAEVPAVDPHGGKLDPDHEPERFLRTAKGSIELVIDGTPEPLTHLPFARNAAVWIPDKKLGRVTVGGSRDDRGPPSLSLVLQGYKLDELELPWTFTMQAVPDGTPPLFRIAWTLDEQTTWRSRDEDTRAGTNELTLQSWKDGVLTGSFRGQVVAPAAGKAGGATKKVSGEFSVSLRLNGVQADPIAKAKKGAK